MINKILRFFGQMYLSEFVISVFIIVGVVLLTLIVPHMVAAVAVLVVLVSSTLALILAIMKWLHNLVREWSGIAEEERERTRARQKEYDEWDRRMNVVWVCASDTIDADLSQQNEN